MLRVKSDHDRIMAEGWVYRTNERGWTIYRDPTTERWYTRAEALAIIEGEMAGAS
jgi:hypothetical protein